jgi:hypothetical protein
MPVLKPTASGKLLFIRFFSQKWPRSHYRLKKLAEINRENLTLSSIFGGLMSRDPTDFGLPVLHKYGTLKY